MSVTKSLKGLHIGLWAAQVILAAIFLMAGATKLFQPIDKMAEMLPWVTSVNPGMVRFIGLSELLGGLGVLLPALTRIKPGLTSIAAGGLALVMVLASAFHISRGETSMIGMNLFFMAVALFIAWGRTKKIPIHAR